MKTVEIFDKLLETRRYCMNQRHGTCEGCPYEKEAAHYDEVIRADIQKLREKLGGN